MLHLIPAPLHRCLYRLADRARRLWWRIARPRRRSVSVVIFDNRACVLLVRHSYGRPVWTLPGGGIGRGEEPAVAAAREIREELRCALAELTALPPFEAREVGGRVSHHVFTARALGQPAADQREITAFAWFDPDALPADTARIAATMIARALAARS